MSFNNRKHIFDVAISYASEEKEIARNIYKALIESNVHAFFDEDYPERLLGAELPVEFEKIFFEESEYCLVIVSKSYIKKPWARLEQQFVLARQIKENKRYILPFQIDEGVKIPGLPSSIGYRSYKSPEDVKNIVISIFCEESELLHDFLSIINDFEERFNDLVTLWQGTSDIEDNFSMVNRISRSIRDFEWIIRKYDMPTISPYLKALIGKAHIKLSELADYEEVYYEDVSLFSEKMYNDSVYELIDMFINIHFDTNTLLNKAKK